MPFVLGLTGPHMERQCFNLVFKFFRFNLVLVFFARTVHRLCHFAFLVFLLPYDNVFLSKLLLELLFFRLLDEASLP